MRKTVLVASKNPVKIQAIREGFLKVFPDTGYEFLSVEVSSGVSDQPFGMEETLTGAKKQGRTVSEHSTICGILRRDRRRSG